MIRGWIGLRKLRIILKHLTRGKNDYIKKVDFKYLFTNYGIVFDDKEIDYIFKSYENEKQGEVNFNEFLDQFNLIRNLNMTQFLPTSAQAQAQLVALFSVSPAAQPVGPLQ